MLKYAYKIRNLGRPNFHRGSSLYKVGPPIEINDRGFLTETRFVIVAFSPSASDHGREETTVFAANEKAQLFGWVSRDERFDAHGLRWNNDNYNDDELLEPRQRVVGRLDHEAALGRLRYVVTTRQSDVDKATQREKAAIKKMCLLSRKRGQTEENMA